MKKIIIFLIFFVWAVGENVLCKIEILNLISIVHGNKGYDNSKNVKDKNMDNHSITLEKFLYPDVVVWIEYEKDIDFFQIFIDENNCRYLIEEDNNDRK